MTATLSAASWDHLRLLARAIDGDRRALELVIEDAGLVQGAVQVGMAPGLALDCKRTGIEAPEEWRRSMHAATATWLLVDEAAHGVAETLDGLEIPWAFVKGYDLGTRRYRQREARPVGDLDALVQTESLHEVRQALEDRGWQSLDTGPQAERYLEEEGYAWQAFGGGSGAPPIVLEIHHRLWGWVPSGLSSALLSRVTAPPGQDVVGGRLDPADAYLLAALHAWTSKPPRPLRDWRDLAMLARSATDVAGVALADSIIDRARRWSVELPVCLSATVADALWQEEVHTRVAESLTSSLSRAERSVLRRLADRGPDGVPLGHLVLARLIAGRPSRAGWRSVWRRVWAHPGTVEKATPSGWSWARRRLTHAVRSVRRP